MRTSSEVEAYSERSYVDRALIRSCTHFVQVRISLWKWRRLSRFCGKYTMSKFSEYKWQRIVSLWHDGFKAPTIARILAKENLPATRQGIQKFLKKYTECGTIGRKEGSGRKSKLTAEVRRLVDENMMEDDETTAKENAGWTWPSCRWNHCTEMSDRAWVDTLW